MARRAVRREPPLTVLIEAHPLAALGVAAGVGLATGALVGRRLATRVTLAAVRAGAQRGLAALGASLLSELVKPPLGGR